MISKISLKLRIKTFLERKWSRGQDENELAIWSTLGLGLALYVATFVFVW